MGISPLALNKIERAFALLTCSLYNPYQFGLDELRAYGYAMNPQTSKDTQKKNKQRDIATLKTLGVTLRWDDSVQPGVYRQTSPICISSFTLHEEEQQELMAVVQEIARLPLSEQPYAHTGLCRILHAAKQQSRRSRLSHIEQATQVAQSNSARDIALPLNDVHRLCIDTALEKHLVISIKYDGGKRQGSYRKLLPHSYFMRENVSYLSCYDYDAHENRCYRLDRIVDVQPTKERAPQAIIDKAPAPSQLNTLPFQMYGTPTPYTVVFWPARVEDVKTNVCSVSELHDVDLLIDDQRVEGVAWSTRATSERALVQWLFEKVTDAQFALFNEENKLCPYTAYLQEIKGEILNIKTAFEHANGLNVQYVPPAECADHTRKSLPMTQPHATSKTTPHTRVSSEDTLRRLLTPLSVLGLERYQDELNALIDASLDDFSDAHAIQHISQQLRMQGIQTTADDLILMWQLLTTASQRMTILEICEHTLPQCALLEKFASLKLMPHEAQAVAHAFALAQPGVDSPLLQRIKAQTFSRESMLIVPPDVTEQMSFTNLASRIQTLTRAYHDHALITCQYTNRYDVTTQRKLHLMSAPIMRNGIHYVDACDEASAEIKSYRLAQMSNIAVSRLQAKRLSHPGKDEQNQAFVGLIDTSKPEVIPVVFAVSSRVSQTIASKVHTCRPATHAELAHIPSTAAMHHLMTSNEELLCIQWNTHSAWLPQYCARMMGKVVGLHPDMLEQTAIELDLLMDAQPHTITFCSASDNAHT